MPRLPSGFITNSATRSPTWAGAATGATSSRSINRASRAASRCCSSVPRPRPPGVARQLPRFAELYPQFHALGVLVFAVSADPAVVDAAAMKRLGLSFPILSDEGFPGGRALGVADPVTEAVGGGGPWCTVIVDPGRRVVKRIGPWGEYLFRRFDETFPYRRELKGGL